MNSVNLKPNSIKNINYKTKFFYFEIMTNLVKKKALITGVTGQDELLI